MKSFGDSLRQTPNGFCEADFLAYLSQRVPTDIAEQLRRDAHPDLKADEFVDLTDLTRPLSEHCFLSEARCCREVRVHLTFILEYTLTGYTIHILDGDDQGSPYKWIYVAVFHLYCSMREAVRSREYVSALLVIERAASQIDLEGQLHVSRFLAWLIRVIPKGSVADPTPVSSAVLALSLVLANCMNNLLGLAEQSVAEERFAQSWEKEFLTLIDERTMSMNAMIVLRRLLSENFRVSGRVEQCAARLRRLGVLSDAET